MDEWHIEIAWDKYEAWYREKTGGRTNFKQEKPIEFIEATRNLVMFRQRLEDGDWFVSTIPTRFVAIRHTID